jgi:hypothetical protein
MGKQPL